MPIPGYLADTNLKYGTGNLTIELNGILNGMFWCNGIGITRTDSTNDLNSFMTFNWFNYNALGSTGFKFIPTLSVGINISTGYTFNDSEFKQTSQETGFRNYSDSFKSSNPSISSNGYNGPGTIRDIFGSNFEHDVQGRIDTDIILHDKVKMSFGAGVLYSYYIYKQHGTTGNVILNNNQNGGLYKSLTFDLSSDGKQMLNSDIYLNFTFDVIPKDLIIELGTRVDHAALFWNGKNNGKTVSQSLNTYPLPNPRFNITYTPVRNLIWLDSMTLSLGSDLFSRDPDSSTFVDEKMG